MSKRWGNILTARDLREEGVDAGTVRLLFATTHYRQALDFSDESLAAAREGSRRLGEFSSRLAGVTTGDGGEFGRLTLVLSDEFAAAMDDDLNTPRALAALFEVAREGNRLLDKGEQPPQSFRDAWLRATGVLQVLPNPERIGATRISATTKESLADWGGIELDRGLSGRFCLPGDVGRLLGRPAPRGQAIPRFCRIRSDSRPPGGPRLGSPGHQGRVFGQARLGGLSSQLTVGCGAGKLWFCRRTGVFG